MMTGTLELLKTRKEVPQLRRQGIQKNFF